MNRIGDAGVKCLAIALQKNQVILSPHFTSACTSSIMQTLEALELGYNGISAIGVHHLATSLKQHRVINSFILQWHIRIHLLPHVDTEDAQPGTQPYWRWWSAVSSRCSSAKYGSFLRYLFIVIHSLSRTVAHYTRSRLCGPRPCWGTTPSYGSATESGSLPSLFTSYGGALTLLHRHYGHSTSELMKSVISERII